MKLIKNGNKQKLTMTKAEWKRIGQVAGWNEDYTSAILPIEIAKYGNRNFAVYIGGGRKLLCVTVYRKGAVAVKEVLTYLMAQLAKAGDPQGNRNEDIMDVAS